MLIFLEYMLCPINTAWAEEDVDTQTSIVVLSIPPACHLDITNPDQSKTLGIDLPLEASYDAGYTDFDAAKPTLTISANKSWKLTVRSSGFNTNGTYKKATEDLLLKDATSSGHVSNSFGSYKALTEVDQEMASYTIGVKAEEHPLQYRILLDYSKDVPGVYTSTVTYTLTTQP